MLKFLALRELRCRLQLDCVCQAVLLVSLLAQSTVLSMLRGSFEDCEGRMQAVRPADAVAS